MGSVMFWVFLVAGVVIGAGVLFALILLFDAVVGLSRVLGDLRSGVSVDLSGIPRIPKDLRVHFVQERLAQEPSEREVELIDKQYERMDRRRKELEEKKVSRGKR